MDPMNISVGEHQEAGDTVDQSAQQKVLS